jgi:hypothetical protein
MSSLKDYTHEFGKQVTEGKARETPLSPEKLKRNTLPLISVMTLIRRARLSLNHDFGST